MAISGKHKINDDEKPSREHELPQKAGVWQGQLYKGKMAISGKHKINDD